MAQCAARASCCIFLINRRRRRGRSRLGILIAFFRNKAVTWTK